SRASSSTSTSPTTTPSRSAVATEIITGTGGTSRPPPVPNHEGPGHGSGAAPSTSRTCSSSPGIARNRSSRPVRPGGSTVSPVTVRASALARSTDSSSSGRPSSGRSNGPAESTTASRSSRASAREPSSAWTGQPPTWRPVSARAVSDVSPLRQPTSPANTARDSCGQAATSAAAIATTTAIATDAPGELVACRTSSRALIAAPPVRGRVGPGASPDLLPPGRVTGLGADARAVPERDRGDGGQHEREQRRARGDVERQPDRHGARDLRCRGAYQGDHEQRAQAPAGEHTDPDRADLQPEQLPCARPALLRGADPDRAQHDHLAASRRGLRERDGGHG